MFNRRKSLFEQMVRAYSGELYRYAYWLCRDRFLAEDLVQDTFARAWNAWASLRDEAAAKTWLYRILHNEHARIFERKRLELVEGQDLDALEDRSLQDAFGEIELHQALHALPTTYREPLILQVLGGFSCEEIAQLLDLTPGAVMTRLSRARLALRRLDTSGRTKEASA